MGNCVRLWVGVLPESNMRQRAVCTVCLCCVVLCYEGVLQSVVLYLQLFVCCSVTLTSDAMNNWCVILNISYFWKIILFVCYVRGVGGVWEREREREYALAFPKYCRFLLYHPVYIAYWDYVGTSGAVVKVLCYKPEGHQFDPRWCHGIFHWHNPSNCLGVDSACNRNEYQGNFQGYMWLVCKADNLTIILYRCHEIWEP